MYQMFILSHKKKLFRSLLCLFTSLYSSQSFGQQLLLKVAGDHEKGFHTEVYYGNRLLITNSEEFTLHLFNSDLSTTTHLQWKGTEWTGDEKNIRLTSHMYLKDFDANLSVVVSYKVISPNIIK